MYPYKVVYLESQILDKNLDWNRKGNADGVHTAKDLEALLVEQAEQGYVLDTITPVTGTAVQSPYSITTTIGYMVTLRQQK